MAKFGEYLESCSSTTKNIMPTSTMPITTNRGRVVAYHEGLLPIKLHEVLITWSYEVMSQTKNVSPQPQYLWPPNLVEW